jgi:hypothetical protein
MEGVDGAWEHVVERAVYVVVDHRGSDRGIIDLSVVVHLMVFMVLEWWRSWGRNVDSVEVFVEFEV